MCKFQLFSGEKNYSPYPTEKLVPWPPHWLISSAPPPDWSDSLAPRAPGLHFMFMLLFMDNAGKNIPSLFC
jgi:hypothetical protein